MPLIVTPIPISLATAITISIPLVILTQHLPVHIFISSLNKAEAGGHSGITTSTADGGSSAITASAAAAGGDDGGGVFGIEIEAGLGGRSVRTSKLDDESETIEVDDIGGDTMNDGDVIIDTSSESVVLGGGGSSKGSTPTGEAGVV